MTEIKSKPPVVPLVLTLTLCVAVAGGLIFVAVGMLIQSARSSLTLLDMFFAVLPILVLATIAGGVACLAVNITRGWLVERKKR